MGSIGRSHGMLERYEKTSVVITDKRKGAPDRGRDLIETALEQESWRFGRKIQIDHSYSSNRFLFCESEWHYGFTTTRYYVAAAGKYMKRSRCYVQPLKATKLDVIASRRDFVSPISSYVVTVSFVFVVRKSC